MHHDMSSIFVHDFKTVTAEVLQNVTNTKCVLLSVGDEQSNRALHSSKFIDFSFIIGGLR